MGLQVYISIVLLMIKSNLIFSRTLILIDEIIIWKLSHRYLLIKYHCSDFSVPLGPSNIVAKQYEGLYRYIIRINRKL